MQGAAPFHRPLARESSVDAVVAATLDELEANRAMFTALARACAPEQLRRPLRNSHWTVANSIAHLAAYDLVAVWYVTAATGRAPAAAQLVPSIDASFDPDAWNESAVRQRAGRGVESLLAEMVSLREQTAALLIALTAEVLTRKIYFPGDARRGAGWIPLRLWLQGWSKHDMVHAQVILDTIPELRQNADFRAWLAEEPILDALGRVSRRTLP